MTDPIRVLVVDDSTVMRKLLRDLLGKEADIRVIDTASNGLDAIEKIKKHSPDVVTLDIEMPKMDGLTALQYIMSEHPVPVVMLSAMDKRQQDITLKALEFGAVDFVPKTSGVLSLDIDKSGDVLLRKIRAASQVRVSKIRSLKVRHVPLRDLGLKQGFWVVAMGASTGGPQAIAEVLSQLPRSIPAAVLIVQHMPEGFTRSFAERLNWYTSLEVKEAAEGDRLAPGLALVAPGDRHMVVDGTKVRIRMNEPVNHVRPSIDVLMSSVARGFGNRAVGVLLTGMGDDGARGLREIKDAGGFCIVQDEATSVIFGMPGAAIERGAADRVSPLDDVGMEIIRALEVM